MKMKDTIKIEIIQQGDFFGSSVFSVSVKITNATSKEIQDIKVDPIDVGGRVLLSKEDTNESEVNELEVQKRQIIKEMEIQIHRAYYSYSFKNMSFLKKLDQLFQQIGNAIIVALFSSVIDKVKDQLLIFKSPVPYYYEEALKINDWNDVERLEKDVMSFEKDDSFLKKAFLINKDKLKRYLERIDEKGKKADSFHTGPSLQPQGSATFPFTIRAPHLLRPRSIKLQFKVSNREIDEGKLITNLAIQEVLFYPSAFAIPSGGILGAICGYFIRLALIGRGLSFADFNWLNLGGSVLLGLLVAIVLSRKPEVNKAITVEDFLGGFIIGALTGMFTENIISKLKLLIQ